MTQDVNQSGPGQTSPVTPVNPSASYAVRVINVTFQLASGTFPGGGVQPSTGAVSSSGNQLTLSNLRVVAHIEALSLPQPLQATILIWGLTPDQVNQLTVAGTSWRIPSQHKNGVLLQAGDATSGLTTVFNGTIVTAYPDFRKQPDVPFVITAVGSQTVQLKPVAPVSFPGSVPVGTALEQICQSAGLGFENNGVNAVLASPYLPGTAWQQINAVIKAANCFGTHDAVNNKIAIWPKNGSRGSGGFVFSAATGMIGYPEFVENVNIRVRSRFSPSVFVPHGKEFTVQSSFSVASGTYVAIKSELDLSAQLPDGPWEIAVLGYVKSAG